MEKKVLRIIDANYNRCREGLRVCEDILRFLDNKHERALDFKKIRRRLSLIVNEFNYRELLSARNTREDTIKFKLSNSNRKLSRSMLFRANFQRSSEALRVLEEISLLVRPESKIKFMKLRFKLYELEKTISGR